MAYNGSGTFLINTAGQPVVAGTVISSTTFNSLTADLATGLSTVITKDGQTTVTANIPMASFKFTGLGVGSAAGDSANLSQVQSTVTKLLTSVSGTDTITAVGAPVVAAYVAGQMFYFVATGDNTTSVTINIDGLGAKAVTRDGSVALVAGDIKSGEVVVVVYDGTRFQVVSQLNSAGNATFANVSITSALNVGGVATFAAGSAAAPSITTTGDTNTGIFFPAADNIAFTEGGVEAMRIDSSGQVGIGTANPAYKLAVAGNNYILHLAATTGTSRVAQLISNTSGQVSIGLESSAGGALFTGAGAYEGCIGTDVSKNFNIGTNGTVRATIDTSGNLGIGTTSPGATLHVKSASASSDPSAIIENAGSTATSLLYFKNSASRQMLVGYTGASYSGGEYGVVDVLGAFPLLFSTNDTERARITAGGLVLLNTSSAFFGTRILQVDGGSGQAAAFKCSTAGNECLDIWNSATSGNNVFVEFQTDGGNARGTISYNRAGGLVAYNTTSDYRAKDILGPVQNSGATIDALKVYEGQMKGATQSRPMLVAHEAQEHAPYAVTGEKDAVNEDGTPKYQQMDVSALVPLLLAEIQSLRARVAQLESK